MASRSAYLRASLFCLAAILSSLVVAACAGIPAVPKTVDSLPFSLSTTYGDRAIIEFEVSSTGDIRIEATWTGTTGELALILNGPGREGAYKRVDGRSHLVVVQTVTPELLALGGSWRASIVNFDTNGTASGTMTATRPAAASGAAARPVAPETLGKELIVHGGFTDGLASWSPFMQNGASATYSVKDGAVVIAINVPGKGSGDIQLTQGAPGFEVKDGATYRLQLDAKGSIPTKFGVTISENGSDVNKDGFAYSAHAGATFEVGGDMKTFTAELHVKGNNPRAGIIFLLGTAKGEITLSNVSLRKIE